MDVTTAANDELNGQVSNINILQKATLLTENNSFQQIYKQK
jgi:hypothetical protein